MLRFAPSPTGDMHIGNLRAAIFNYIVAKQRDEKLLIRIEDTDMARNIEGKDKEILFLLSLFGIQWDNLVYQSDNFERHRQLAKYLIDNNKAFYCYCTKEFLEQKRQESLDKKEAFRYNDKWATIQKDSNNKPVIRLRGATSDMSFYDDIKGELHFSKNEIDSFVILKDDGIPTYNFACSCDDMIYDISCIIRGEDHVSNTPKQLLIHRDLNNPRKIEFAHLPIILNEEGKKMSKRESSSSVQYLLECGFLPQAIANYLILLGNKTPCEVFNIQEAIEWFDLKKLSHAPARFDIDKLRFLNREHFKRLSEQEISLLLDFKDPAIGGLAKLYLQESSTLNELRDKIGAIFNFSNTPRDFGKFSKEAEILRQEILRLSSEVDLTTMDFNDFKNALLQQEGIKEANIKGASFFKPLRILLTGHEHGPEISDLFLYLRHFIKDIVR